MIEEVMKEITAAEAEARELISAADAKAAGILSGITAEIDAMIEKSAGEEKNKAKEALDVAAKDAERIAQDYIKKEVEAAEKSAARAEKDNLDKAVEYILEEITDING